MYPDENLIFLGLPATNSGFGLHTLTMTVQGQPWELAIIETFFSASANNHAGAIFDTVIFGNQMPNWFFYYSLLYPAPGPYDPSRRLSVTSNLPPYDIKIGRSANEAEDRRVYVISSDTGLITYAGYISLGGILRYISACGHEEGHRYYLQNGILIPGRPRTVNPNFDPDAPNANLADDPDGDWDQDGLSNSWKMAHHLDPKERDTTGEHPDSTSGDSEVTAEIYEMQEVVANKGLWAQDWADTGLQWGAWRSLERGANVDKDLLPWRPWSYKGTNDVFAQPDPPSNWLHTKL